MKVVVDIDENIYHRFIMGFANEDDSILIGKLFKHGTVLPKLHGILIDAEPLIRTNAISESYARLFCVIEADKGEE